MMVLFSFYVGNFGSYNETYVYQKRSSVLKKSLSARSAVEKRPETRPKHYENGVF